MLTYGTEPRKPLETRFFLDEPELLSASVAPTPLRMNVVVASGAVPAIADDWDSLWLNACLRVVREAA